jgi:hypothetical protein
MIGGFADGSRIDAAARCAAAKPRVASDVVAEIGAARGLVTTAVLDGVHLASYPDVAEPWATTAYLLAGPPPPATWLQVRHWLLTHAVAGQYSVTTRQAFSADPAWASAGLGEFETLPTYAVAAPAVTSHGSAVPAGVTLDWAPSPEDFWAAYGSWIGDIDPAGLVPRT